MCLDVAMFYQKIKPLEVAIVQSLHKSQTFLIICATPQKQQMHCTPQKKVRFQLSKRFSCRGVLPGNREYLFSVPTVPEAFPAWTGVSTRLVPLPFLGVLATSDVSTEVWRNYL